MAQDHRDNQKQGVESELLGPEVLPFITAAVRNVEGLVHLLQSQLRLKTGLRGYQVAFSSQPGEGCCRLQKDPPWLGHLGCIQLSINERPPLKQDLEANRLNICDSAWPLTTFYGGESFSVVMVLGRTHL